MEGGRPRPCTSTYAGAAAAAITAYNEDLLKEILILLPAKSLIRFKSVSKLWDSLISAASFSHLHTRRHRREPQSSFLLRAAPSEYFYFSPGSKIFLPFKFNCTKTTILQSCHGLLLLECSNPNKNYYVYNPTTRQSRNLLIENKFLCGLCLAHDPLKSPYYKVVCVRTNSSSIHWWEIQVYDSEIHKWKRFEMNYPASFLPEFNNVVYYNNCIYWTTYLHGLLCFDIEFGFFSEPDSIMVFKCKEGLRTVGTYLMESTACVHFFAEGEEGMSPLNMMVYEVIEQNDDWFVNARINCYLALASFDGELSLIGIVRGEDEEKWSLMFHVPGKIMVCGFDNDGSFEEELIDLRMQKFYRAGKLQFECHDAFEFIESLIPI